MTLRTVAVREISAGSMTITLSERVFALRLGPAVVVRRRPWAVSVAEAGRVSRRHIPDVTRRAQAGIILVAVFCLWALLATDREQQEA